MALRIAAAPYRGRIVVKDFGAYKAELHLDEIMEMAAYQGSFERDVVARIETMTKPGMTVLDIGANVGLHALRFAALAKGGKVYAFEPTPFAFDKLAKNAGLNPHLSIEPLRLALSDHARAAMMDFRSSWQHNGTRADGGPAHITFVRLDDWVAQNGIAHVDLIKIDIDGFEGLAFEGARSTLMRFRPPIIAEASVYQYEQGRPDPFRILAKLGYVFEDMGGHRLDAAGIKARVAALDEQYEPGFNVVARHA
ncbi:FkbM family methyltransferase [Sphingosinicella sp. LHD-64]|uniref:FkbM family methyltransferase n=1 Tax=Sphingosinicella sp. LHD-64 TaxID=3072139 RepID=UPI00280EE2F2|nr:FkbM family methyltransferase [Sphingosinicella sp. LHD-64]MDQ8757762.1 FkbM family methyltransferase [Sphingosinicella sp. LHD-64]